MCPPLPSLAETPLLLSGGNSSAGGVAWLSVDKACVLHYQVHVSGLEGKERHLLEMLQVRPGKHHAPLQRVLKRFEGEQVMVIMPLLCLCRYWPIGLSK